MNILQCWGQGQGSACEHPQLWAEQEQEGAERVLQFGKHDCRFGYDVWIHLDTFGYNVWICLDAMFGYVWIVWIRWTMFQDYDL